ncbi:hypothetical protein OIU84_000911 [Salix udensis]|uniref:Uncharacterized protein n=1 Tax=Salix udensis TaxID=889485 RepID=A0AAD6L5T5_9ROSI|nr:hypothetical protein OIU84_000911 [Salix udensis]
MSFFVGLIIGLAVGLALIVGFVRSENARSKLRSELLDWLNQHLTKLWPNVDAAASGLIKASVEPVLEQYRPFILSSLKFSKFTLGTVAPQFTGVSIIEDGGNGITMELEMNWDGNPSIILGIKTRFGVSLPVQVKDIGFTGVFRLIFKPLVPEFPCFGAVCYSLRQKKKMDFTLKVIGGDISAIPGLDDAIQETIRNAVEDSITWPVRKVVPILPGDYSDLELKPVGILEVKLVQAKALTNKDFIGKSDPFAKLYIRPLPDKTKTSKIINNDLNPIWNEHFEFVVEDTSTQHLVVKVYDDEGLQASELLGCAQVKLSELEPGKVKDVWLKLVKDLEVQRDNKNRGQVHLELLYCPFGVENDLVNPFSSDFSMTSLEKVLKSGANGTEINGNGNEITQKRRERLTNKTRVVNNCLNPVWNQTFDFVVEDGLHDMLIIEVWDHDTFGKFCGSIAFSQLSPQDYMGRCILTLTRVILEGEYKDCFQLDEVKSGRLNLQLKWTAQHVYRDS